MHAKLSLIMEQTIQTTQPSFSSTLFKLALPIAIQNAISSSLHLVDNVMLGQLGTVEIAAVGLANRFYLIFILITFALGSGTSIFTAQFWGKRDIEYIGKVMGIALIVNLSIAFLFSLTALFFPEWIMSVFTKDTAVTQTGSEYFRIIAFSYLMTAITMLYAFVLRSIGHTQLPMYASIIALALNTFLNYCLIFGHFGFPAWQVKGAALATLIARIIEAGIILVVTYWKKYPVVKPSDLFAIPVTLIKQFFTIILPVVANEFSWVMGITVYAIVYGRMGTEEVAAINIVEPVERMSNSIFFGLASAAAVMIGNQIGAGHENKAFSYAKRFAVLGLSGALVVGGVIALTAPLIVSFFNVTPEARRYALYILYILSIVFCTRTLNLITVVGILRGGGDTTFSMYLEMGSIWLVGVPLALFGGFWLKVPVYWVFALVSIEEIVKAGLGIYRIYSRKWIHNLVKDTPTSP